MYRKQLLARAFDEYVKVFKEGIVTEVTLDKYHLTSRVLHEIAADVTLDSLTRMSYQKILNEYAKNHHKTTVTDFHHQVHACVAEAFEEGIINRDPCKKPMIHGNSQRKHCRKYLNEDEFEKLVKYLEPLNPDRQYDMLLMFIAKTGARFAEACGITPEDIDFVHNTVSINKTFDYKSHTGGFMPTKNKFSVRTIAIDPVLAYMLHDYIRDKQPGEPCLWHTENGRIFNASVCTLLHQYCEQLGITVISVHALRHTHASVLLGKGISLQSVAKRLGHSNTTTTERYYIHLLSGMEQKDNDKITGILSAL